jgi:hypothetical protein
MLSGGLRIVGAALYGSFVMTMLAGPTVASGEVLTGAAGSSPEVGSGWIDLAPPVDFAKGDRLRLVLGGTANKVFVRLLPKGQTPDTSAGIIGRAIDVPATRIIEVTLPQERKQIVQISVHGGANPWNKFPLTPGNGPATLKSAERIRP